MEKQETKRLREQAETKKGHSDLAESFCHRKQCVVHSVCR